MFARMKARQDARWMRCPRCREPRTRYTGSKADQMFGAVVACGLAIGLGIMIAPILPFVAALLFIGGPVVLVQTVFGRHYEHRCEDCGHRWNREKDRGR